MKLLHLPFETSKHQFEGETTRHMAPDQNWDQLATQPRNKCFLMKIDKHLEYLNTRTVLELVLGQYLQSLRALRVVLL